jgi:hypothetical protein
VATVVTLHSAQINPSTKFTYCFRNPTPQTVPVVYGPDISKPGIGFLLDESRGCTYERGTRLDECYKEENGTIMELAWTIV